MAKVKAGGKKPKVSLDSSVAVCTSYGMVATQASVKLIKKFGKGKKGRKRKNKRPKSAKGEPVSVTSGEVYDEALDLALPGPIRVEYRRHYTSGTPEESTPLGRGGWMHSFDQWIEARGERTVLRSAEAGDIEFASLEPRTTALLRGHRLEIQRGPEHSYVVFDLQQRLYREFRPLGPGSRCVLRSIRDGFENRVDLQYEADRLVRVIAPANREIRFVHDAKGRITRVETWARGQLQQQVSYTYTSAGELATVTNPVGARESFAYDGLHRMVKATRRSGISFHYRYHESNGRCSKTWGDGGLFAVEFTYDLNEGTTTTHGEPEPRIFHWNADGAVLREATLDGRFVKEFEYDEDGLLVSRSNAAGETTAREYDARGNCVKEIDPAGNVLEFEYANDLPVRRKDARSGERRYTYDARGALTSVTTAAGVSRTITRDGYGRVLAVYGPDGPVSTYEYDDEHNRIAHTDGRGATWRYTFDALGYAITKTDPIGRTWQAAYDELRRVVGMTYPDGTRAAQRHDASDNIVEVVNPQGGITRIDFAGNVPERYTLPDGRSWTFTHDRMQRLLSIKNPRAETYEFTYDPGGRVVEEKTFDGRTVKYGYSRAGRISRIEHSEDDWCELKHDPLGNVVLVQSPHGPTSYERDSIGRLLSAVFEEGGLRFEIKREYDDAGHVIAEEQNGEVIRYEYDLRGRCVSRTLPGGERTHYRYGLGVALSALEHDGAELRVELDVLGRESRAYMPKSGVDVQLRWGGALYDRPVEEIVTAPVAPGQAARATLSHRTWSYDHRGRLDVATDARWGTVRYAYDEAYQLVEEAGPDGRVFYDYDAASSLQAVIVDLAKPPQPWFVEAGGLLRRTADAEYEYDACHRRKRKTELKDWKHPGDTTEYTWDTRSQLREVRFPDGSRVRYFYDPFGRRCRKEITPAVSLQEMADGKEPAVRVVRFLWDDDVICQEVDSEYGKRVFVHGPRTFKLIFQEEQGEVFLVLDDTRGVPACLIDSKGRVAWAGEHSAWGIRRRQWRPPSASFARPIESPFRLLGHYHDSETGFSSTRSRYFDATTGRWLSPDPVGLRGGFNLFGFNASPTVVADPLGLAPVQVGDDYPINSLPAAANGSQGGYIPCAAADGGKVWFTEAGFPVFDPYAVAAVRVPLTNRDDDIDNAWKALQEAREDAADNETGETFSTVGGLKRVNSGGEDENGVKYTWHHTEDIDENGCGLMLLVRSDIHAAVKHTGGDAINRLGCK
jgi:RHS repeat-associated protein